jgi:hypothetical protein
MDMELELELRQKKNNGILTLENKQEDPEF